MFIQETDEAYWSGVVRVGGEVGWGARGGAWGVWAGALGGGARWWWGACGVGRLDRHHGLQDKLVVTVDRAVGAQE